MTANDDLLEPFHLPQPRVKSRAASVESLAAATALAGRVRHREAPLRRSFLNGPVPGLDVTPLALVLRGRADRAVGRGGEVRLKLLLSLLWVAGADPYDATFPARAWATLLNLRNPEDAGARRVTQAFAWLDEHDFVQVEARKGRPARVTLLRETGSGADYEPPGLVSNRLGQRIKDSEGRERSRLEARQQRERYLRLKPELWTEGWVQVLSSSALAMLLVVMAELGGNAVPDKEMWLSPDLAVRRYGLSDATRSNGLRELTALRVLRMQRRSVNRDVFDYQRMRNVYSLDNEVLLKPPVPPAAPLAPAPAPRNVAGAAGSTSPAAGRGGARRRVVRGASRTTGQPGRLTP